MRMKKFWIQHNLFLASLNEFCQECSLLSFTFSSLIHNFFSVISLKLGPFVGVDSHWFCKFLDCFLVKLLSRVSFQFSRLILAFSPSVSLVYLLFFYLGSLILLAYFESRCCFESLNDEVARGLRFSLVTACGFFSMLAGELADLECEFFDLEALLCS